MNPPHTKAPGDIPLVHTIYDTFVKWNTILPKFPKTQRFALGESCSRQFLAILEFVLSAASNRNVLEKRKSLMDANAKLDLLKLLIRLSKDSQCLSNTQYLNIQSGLHDSGKMLGGWIKSLSETKSA